MQVWTLGLSHPSVAADQARRAEADGYDGWYCVDSQNLAGDAYVGLTSAALATERIGLGPGVTNPVTRHPAVTAAAIASLQIVSAGRAVLGIGRGDSSLAHVGRAPATPASFERTLRVVQAYLSGRAVDFDDLPGDAPPVESLGLADAPERSSLTWLRPAGEDHPKVPVEVAATGPRVLDIASRHADRVLLAVGADPERVSWAAETVRERSAEVPLGAFVNVACHPDVDTARRLVRGGLSTFARFSVMHGKVAGPVSADQRAVLDRLHGGYDMREHTRADSAQAGLLDPAFVDRFAVVGPPDVVLERLRSLADHGIDKVVVIGPTAGADRDAAREARSLFTNEVLPALRRG